MNCKPLLLAGLAAAAAFVTNADADSFDGDTITLERIKRFVGRSVESSYSSSRAWDADPGTIWGTALAGVHFNTVVATGDRVTTFCAEFEAGIADRAVTYDVSNIESVEGFAPPRGITTARSILLQDLYARYHDRVNTVPTGDETREDYAAAFQLVIWEIIHENLTSDTEATTGLGELNVSIGAMAFRDLQSHDAVGIAEEMIAGLGDGGFRSFAGLLGLASSTSQDMMMITVVPAPTVAALAGLGLVGMRRRRR